MCLHARARLRVQFPMERMADKHGVTRKYPGRNGNTPLSFHQKMNAYNSEQNRLRAIQGIHEAWNLGETCPLCRFMSPNG